MSVDSGLVRDLSENAAPISHMDDKLLKIITASLTMFAMFGCSSHKEAAVEKSAKTVWGKTAEGQPVDLYTLTNSKGAEARVITYGGIVVSLKVPDRTGALGDVVAGFDNIDGY